MPIPAFGLLVFLFLASFSLLSLLIRAQDQGTTFTTTPEIPVELRACCGNDDKCEHFTRPEEMFGIRCCNDEPYNQYEEICCDGKPRSRRQSNSFIDRCCGNQTQAYDQTCCLGVLHNIPSGECCGQMAYPRNSFNTLCCNGTLLTNVDPTLTCCGNQAYDGGKREICCGGEVLLKELFDGCCAIHGKNPPEYQEFNTRTQQCCDKPIERFGSTKCCYLRNSQGQFYPRSYDINTHCCVPPFTQIGQKDGNGTCTIDFASDAGGGGGMPSAVTTTQSPSQPSPSSSP